MGSIYFLQYFHAWAITMRKYPLAGNRVGEVSNFLDQSDVQLKLLQNERAVCVHACYEGGTTDTYLCTRRRQKI